VEEFPSILSLPHVTGPRSVLEGGASDETLPASRSEELASDGTSALAVRIGDGSKSVSCFAWMALLHCESGAVSCSRTGSFVLPKSVVDLMAGGMELGHADDAVFGRTNSKHAGGSVGLLTRGLINRTEYYVHALQLAAAPFLWPDKYGVTTVPGHLGSIESGPCASTDAAA